MQQTSALLPSLTPQWLWDRVGVPRCAPGPCGGGIEVPSAWSEVSGSWLEVCVYISTVPRDNPEGWKLPSTALTVVATSTGAVPQVVGRRPTGAVHLVVSPDLRTK